MAEIKMEKSGQTAIVSSQPRSRFKIESGIWQVLTLRSMEYSPHHKAYFIIAGPPGEEQKFALYRWSEGRVTQPVLVRKLSFEKSNFTPEALIPFRNSTGLMLLSDDGTLVIQIAGPHECIEGQFRKDGTCLNKFLLETNKKLPYNLAAVLTLKPLVP